MVLPLKTYGQKCLMKIFIGQKRLEPMVKNVHHLWSKMSFVLDKNDYRSRTKMTIVILKDKYIK